MGKHVILPKRLDILEVGNKNCQFRINVDVLNEAFGIGRSLHVKGGFPNKKDTWILGNKPEDKFMIWMPKLYSNSSEWINSISEDGTAIYETSESKMHCDWMELQDDVDFLRIVFVKETPSSPYIFVGVFENGEMNYKNHSYRRIATKVKLIGNPAMRVELLDDIR